MVKKDKLLIGNFYRSPNSSSVSDEELYSLIQYATNLVVKKFLLVILITLILIGCHYQVLVVPVILVISF